MNSGNPALNQNAFNNLDRTSGPPMTVTGSVSKSAFLLLLVILGSTVTWSMAGPMSNMLCIGGAIGGFVFAMITIFKKTWSPVTAPIYALLEGLFLGGISAMYSAQFDKGGTGVASGIVTQAIMLTFGVLAAMLGLYQSRIIRVTETFRFAVVAATMGIALVYLVTIVLGFFNIQIPMIHGSGTMGILFSLFVVGIAAMNLALDFDFIERGVAAGAPRYMEWYAAFGLMVTLIWLYLEILRLLSKLQRR